MHPRQNLPKAVRGLCRYGRHSCEARSDEIGRAANTDLMENSNGRSGSVTRMSPGWQHVTILSLLSLPIYPGNAIRGARAHQEYLQTQCRPWAATVIIVDTMLVECRRRQV